MGLSLVRVRNCLRIKMGFISNNESNILGVLEAFFFFKFLLDIGKLEGFIFSNNEIMRVIY